ncbi:MAG: hypothetical protein MUC87_14140 [Bacteroidia bacterium]|jgi:hypothetical protein|nr:hypothetical protein [Bacteroidia bacterium]
MKSTVGKLLVALLLCLLMPVSGMACLNEYGYHGAQGKGYDNLHGFENLPDRHFNKIHPADSVCSTYQDSSDFAVYLLKQGYVGRGIKILFALSHAHPREYEIAANLGTAYELAGLNDSALKWIEYSLTLNPDAHEGTEWVHTDILKTKIALAKNPDWLSTHHVLDIDRSRFGNSIFANNPGDLKLRDVLRSIYVQLTERLPFTSPGDKIMGDICTDAAQIMENTSIEVSMAWWKLAKEFGTPAVSPDPAQRIIKLREAGSKIPHRGELEPIPEGDSVKVNRRRFAIIHYHSFTQFSNAKSWKLKDETVLKSIIEEQKKLALTKKLPAAPVAAPEEKNTDSKWIWILGIGAAVLTFLFIGMRMKR